MWLAQWSWDRRLLMGRGDRTGESSGSEKSLWAAIRTWIVSLLHGLTELITPAKGKHTSLLLQGPFSPALINLPCHKTFILSFKSNKTCYLQSWKFKSTSKLSDKSLQLKPDKMKSSNKQKAVPSRPVLCTLLFRSSCSSYPSHLSVAKHSSPIYKTAPSKAAVEESGVPCCVSG